MGRRSLHTSHRNEKPSLKSRHLALSNRPTGAATHGPCDKPIFVEMKGRGPAMDSDRAFVLD